MNIAHIEKSLSIYGPGERYVIWTQGCSIRCKGCWNQDMWSNEQRNPIEKEKILEEIRQQTNCIEGVTFLGGEPLDQLDELFWLIKRIQSMGVSVLIFTGFEMEEIQNTACRSILSYTDILVTGRYQEDLRTVDHQWIGSLNQEIHFLTSRYSESIIENGNYVEIVIDESGKETILGFPDGLKQY